MPPNGRESNLSLNISLDLGHLNQVTDTWLAASLAQVANQELLPLVDLFLTRRVEYDKTLLDTCLAAIDSRGLVTSTLLSPYLTEESNWRRTTSGMWLTAQLLELRGQSGPARLLWDQIINENRGAIHEAYLNRARLHLNCQHFPEAFIDLRCAITGQDDYHFLSKAARLFTRLRHRARPPALRHIRLALLSSTTTNIIAPLLQLACFRDGIDAELYVADYGLFQQEILTPTSDLYTFKPDVALITTHWRDAHVPPFVDNPEEHIQRVSHQFSQLWATLLQRHACHIIQHNFDLPAIDSFGHLSLSLPGGRGHLLRDINRRLQELAPAAVTILDLDQLSANYGKRAWFDPTYWHVAKQYPAASALPCLIDQQVALIRAGLGLTKKVLVLDLDNTLWGGVIGEEGLAGIRLGPPSAAGEAYQALQHYLVELKKRDILLAVCSKNNLHDAQLPFLHHDATILHLDDFVAFTANWLDKPANLRHIAQQLNLGLDSFVFMDDNPIERALVRRQIPEVAVPELEADPATYIAALDKGLYFEALTFSSEDRDRHRSYQENALRQELQTAAASLEDFLSSLNMEAEIGPFNESVLARVTQLIGKTNQFNLTTRRYSEEQLRHMMTSNQYWTHYFKLSDRFGDNGLVGVMIARWLPLDLPTWTIDTWLMSCRVIGRQLEQLMLEVLIDAASAQGVPSIQGVYIPTNKNGLVADLYSRLGFVKITEGAQGELHYTLDLTTSAPIQRSTLIRLKPIQLPALVQTGS